MDKFVSEVNGGHGLIEHGLILYVPPKNGGLADSAVSDQDDLVLRTTECCLFGWHLIKNGWDDKYNTNLLRNKKKKEERERFGVRLFPVG